MALLCGLRAGVCPPASPVGVTGHVLACLEQGSSEQDSARRRDGRGGQRGAQCPALVGFSHTVTEIQTVPWSSVPTRVVQMLCHISYSRPCPGVTPAQLWGCPGLCRWETGAWEHGVENSLMSSYSSMQVQIIQNIQNISRSIFPNKFEMLTVKNSLKVNEYELQSGFCPL